MKNKLKINKELEKTLTKNEIKSLLTSIENVKKQIKDPIDYVSDYYPYAYCVITKMYNECIFAVPPKINPNTKNYCDNYITVYNKQDMDILVGEWYRIIFLKLINENKIKYDYPIIVPNLD